MTTPEAVSTYKLVKESRFKQATSLCSLLSKISSASVCFSSIFLCFFVSVSVFLSQSFHFPYLYFCLLPRCLSVSLPPPYLSVCLSAFSPLSVCLLPIYPSVCLPVSICLSVYLSASSHYMGRSLYLLPSVCLPPPHLSDCLSASSPLSVCLPVCLCLSICLFVYLPPLPLSVSLAICLSLCLLLLCLSV